MWALKVDEKTHSEKKKCTRDFQNPLEQNQLKHFVYLTNRLNSAVFHFTLQIPCHIWSQAGAGNQGLHTGLPCNGQEASDLSHCHCLPGVCHSRELEAGLQARQSDSLASILTPAPKMLLSSQISITIWKCLPAVGT